jgi:hypothetical protein
MVCPSKKLFMTVQKRDANAVYQLALMKDELQCSAEEKDLDEGLRAHLLKGLNTVGVAVLHARENTIMRYHITRQRTHRLSGKLNELLHEETNSGNHRSTAVLQL